MPRKKKTKEVAIREEAQVPSTEVMNFEADSGAGFEGADSQSYAIPYLTILQSNSPQVDEDDGKYVKGAKVGMLINTVTEEIYDGKKGMSLIPCTYQRLMVEWVPRDAGGGFRGQHNPADINMASLEKDESGRFRMENGNFLADTRYHFVLILNEDGTTTMAVISLTSTQIKKSKNWMTLMNTLKVKNSKGRMFTPPMFSHVYTCSTVSEENDKGKWKGWKFTTDRILTEEESAAYIAAKNFRDMVIEGSAHLTQPPDAAASNDDDSDTPF